MRRGVPAASAAEPPSMHARCRRRYPHARAARGCVREKILENSCAFRNASPFARARRDIDGGGGAPSTRSGSAFANAEKSLRRATDFAPQHPICAKSRGATTVDGTRWRSLHGMRIGVHARFDPCRSGNGTGRLRGRIGVPREWKRGVSVPLPRAVRRSRRGRGVRSTARVPRPPPRTASRRRRRLR